MSLKSAYNWVEKLSVCGDDLSSLRNLIKTPGVVPTVTSLKNIKIAEVLQNDNSLTQNGIRDLLNRENIICSQPSVSLALKKIG
ncbi:hypothetical protein HZS_3817, partial [Henneguya salminicola]